MQRIESLTLSLTLRSCLAAALRRQRLSLHEEYEEFKQRVDGQAQLIQLQGQRTSQVVSHSNESESNTADPC